MSIKINHLKPAIKKKNNVIQIGGESEEVRVQGSLKVSGPIQIPNPVESLKFNEAEHMKMFGVGSFGVGFYSVSPQTIVIDDQTSGVDNFFVQTTRGFSKNNTWVLNPGASNMESGLVLFTLESRIFVSGSGINSGLYFEHKKGERLININYTL